MKSLFRQKLKIDSNFTFSFDCDHCYKRFKTNLAVDAFDYNHKTFFDCPYCNLVTIRIYKGHDYKKDFGGYVYMFPLEKQKRN